MVLSVFLLLFVPISWLHFDPEMFRGGFLIYISDLIDGVNFF
jgi:hypothetical protein